MSTRAEVIAALAPLAERIATLDLSDPGAGAALHAAVPPDTLGDLEAMLRAARSDGWLTPREAGGVAFGRIAKADPATHGMTIDVVDIAGVGAAHTHPEGEVSMCFATHGDPRFDGHPAGWVVKPPGSHHAPTVTGGRMLIVYFLPHGSIVWDPA